MNAMEDVAAFKSKTEGGLELLTKAACNTGELELNMSVMNPMIVSPRLYSLSLSREVFVEVDLELDLLGANSAFWIVSMSLLNGLIKSLVEVLTSAVVNDERFVLDDKNVFELDFFAF